MKLLVNENSVLLSLILIKISALEELQRSWECKLTNISIVYRYTPVFATDTFLRWWQTANSSWSIRSCEAGNTTQNTSTRIFTVVKTSNLTHIQNSRIISWTLLNICMYLFNILCVTLFSFYRLCTSTYIACITYLYFVGKSSPKIYNKMY